MTKIAGVVKLKIGYANFVELKSAFLGDTGERGRMMAEEEYER